MDIVDVDEALKDDSFIFLEDKTHDDISNILQQWKSNNSIPPSNYNPQQPLQQPQHPQEQAYKYDSRTFTRPKRKSSQNLEMQFTNSMNSSQHQQLNNLQIDNPMLNVEIGGLVTNMHKSFLQDTSPPPFSSMDASMDRMNNSLITSADFSNINFLQSTSSLDFCGTDAVGYSNFNLTGKITNDGYTLSDMIRDRKALESLTMSSDGTLIKDSHIGQIDDISLTLSKTASGCSTMDNSTESVEINNRTVQLVSSNLNQTFNDGVQLELAACNDLNASESNNTGSRMPFSIQKTMILSDEMIGDITYNLIENSMHTSIQSEQAVNVTRNIEEKQYSSKESVSKPPSILHETVSLSNGEMGSSSAFSLKTINSTFDSENITPDTRCETPEGIEKNTETVKFYESTPQTTSIRYNKHHYTPTLKMIDDVNISPITATSGNTTHNVSRILNETFESKNDQPVMNQTNNVINTNTFTGKLPLINAVEMIENMENPTFDKGCLEELHSPASLEMKNVMELAQAEANLLASNNDEEEFDHMLDEFSKVELNAEQIKMKKSLDSIKKRFNYGSNRNKMQQREISREAKDMRDMIRVSADILGEDDNCTKDYLNMTMDIIRKDKDNMNKPNEHMMIESPNDFSETLSDVAKSPLRDSCTTSSITDSKTSNGLSLSSVSNASNGGERLLSRRSRLYDGFNMSTVSAHSANSNKVSLGSSFTIHKDDDNISEVRPNVTNETENLSCQNDLEMVQEKTESTTEEQMCQQTTNNSKLSSNCSQYRLSEKRERDRDRFKTIKINKTLNCVDGNVESVSGLELNVPCIDDYAIEVNSENLEDSEQTNQRYSRRDRTISPVFNNNKSEVNIETANKSTSKINQNFLTYKKQKDKQQANIRNLPEIASGTTNTIVAPEIATSKPRSLSRPRYLSGLTKFSAVSKATSADELEKTISRLTNLNATTSALNMGISKGASAANVSLNPKQIGKANDKQKGELKSPMGIKSKSFHNLSNHHTYATNSAFGGGGLPIPKNFGLKKPSATGISTEKLAKANLNRNLPNHGSVQNSSTQQKYEESVFKVPKLVSGIRAPGSASCGTTTKRAGLVRPSSGYYSLTVTAKGVQPPTTETDCDTGRHSPTDSMSSASSKGSAQSLTKAAGIKVPNASSSAATAVLTKITIGSTGIPKPSGLRPPSSVKRSGLPRPSSFIKTDK